VSKLETDTRLAIDKCYAIDDCIFGNEDDSEETHRPNDHECEARTVAFPNKTLSIALPHACVR